MAARKKFIDIEIPLLDETISVLGTPESLQGKSIKLDLTRKLRGKSLEIIFKIFEKDKKLIALPKKMQLMKFYISRMMRKRTNYVEDSFKIQCSDAKAIIKPFLITRKKVSRAVRSNLRNTAKQFLMEYAKEKRYFEICEEILSGEMQKAMHPKLKKVYPLSFCEIRIFETKELEKLKLEMPKKKESEEESKTISQKTTEDAKIIEKSIAPVVEINNQTTDSTKLPKAKKEKKTSVKKTKKTAKKTIKKDSKKE